MCMLTANFVSAGENEDDSIIGDNLKNEDDAKKNKKT